MEIGRQYFFKKVDNFSKIVDIRTNLISGYRDKLHPRISILIPTYKRENLLKEAIDSVLEQVKYIDFELIVIDNNPERGCLTEKLILSYDDPKLIYFKNECNLGMFGNWNRGFEIAASEWVVLLHDDDLISPFFLHFIDDYLDKYPSASIIKPYSEKFSKSKPVFFEPHEKKALYKISKIDFAKGCAIGAPTHIVIRKDTLIKLGGFNQDFYPSSDYVFCSMCASHFDVYILPIKLGAYRVEDNASLSNKTMNLFFKNRFLISSEIMLSLGVPETLVLKIQAYLIPRVTKITNKNYSSTYCFTNSDLDLQENSHLVNFMICIFDKALDIILALRRRLR